MKAFTIALALAGFVAALPAQVEERQTPYTACSGLYGTSQCCATDVLGVADLDCANRMFSLLSLAERARLDKKLTMSSKPPRSRLVPPTSRPFARMSASVRDAASCLL